MYGECTLQEAATGRCSLGWHADPQRLHNALIMNWTICAVWLSQAIFKPSFIQPRFTRSSFLARPCFTLIKFHSSTPGICQLLTLGLYTQQLHWTVAPSRTQLWLFFKQRKAILINFASQIWQNDLSVLIILPSPLSNVTLILLHRSNDAVRADLTRCILRPHYGWKNPNL